MLRKDYLLRQIEMLSGFVARLLKMRETGDAQGAIDEIEQAYNDLFGLDPRLISLLPNEFLLDKLRSGEYLDADQSFTLAVVLREDAANYLLQGNTQEHYQRLTRSLKVYLALALEHNLAPEQAELYEVDEVLGFRWPITPCRRTCNTTCSITSKMKACTPAPKTNCTS